MKYKKILTPDGFDDCLHINFTHKNNIEVKLHNVFNSYGFNRIKSPALEYIDVFNNKGSMNLKDIFKFIDKDGEILALKPDITPSIARIVANNFNENEIPYRLCYIDNTFAQKRNYHGKAREITQAGVELIGIDSIKSDSEIILLAINSLLEAGLSNFKIEIGNVKFLQGILSDLNLHDDQVEVIQELIIKGDFAQVSNYINSIENCLEDIYIEFFDNLFLFNGQYELIEKAKKYAKNETSLLALDRLLSIYEFLVDAGVSEYVNFDLSMIGHFDYYTGLIFHGYTKGIEYSIIDGGRYDNLINNFGIDLPAIGFAIKVDGLLSGIYKQNINEFSKNTDTLISYENVGRIFALNTAQELRNDGAVVEFSLFDQLEQTIEYAKNNNFGGILHFKNDKIVQVIDINGDTKDVHISELLGGN